MTGRTLCVLGIDTSLRSTGIGVVHAQGNQLTLNEYGLIRAPASRPLSQCLQILHQDITECIARTTPQVAAIEGVFYGKNAKTSMILGEARGTAITACTLAGLPIYEYAPRRVKQAITGFGSASKQQVQRMIMSLLHMDNEPPEDASDALAIAICHLHTQTTITALAPDPL